MSRAPAATGWRRRVGRVGSIWMLAGRLRVCEPDRERVTVTTATHDEDRCRRQAGSSRPRSGGHDPNGCCTEPAEDRAFGRCEPGDAPAPLHNPPSAFGSHAFVPPERLDRSVIRSERKPERDGIFQRLRSPLTGVRKHRMGRIAEQCHGPTAPVSIGSRSKSSSRRESPVLVP